MRVRNCWCKRLPIVLPLRDQYAVILPGETLDVSEDDMQRSPLATIVRVFCDARMLRAEEPACV